MTEDHKKDETHLEPERVADIVIAVPRFCLNRGSPVQNNIRFVLQHSAMSRLKGDSTYYLKDFPEGLYDWVQLAEQKTIAGFFCEKRAIILRFKGTSDSSHSFELTQKHKLQAEDIFAAGLLAVSSRGVIVYWNLKSGTYKTSKNLKDSGTAALIGLPLETFDSISEGTTSPDVHDRVKSFFPKTGIPTQIPGVFLKAEGKHKRSSVSRTLSTLNRSSTQQSVRYFTSLPDMPPPLNPPKFTLPPAVSSLTVGQGARSVETSSLVATPPQSPESVLSRISHADESSALLDQSESVSESNHSNDQAEMDGDGTLCCFGRGGCTIL